jgi:hypothetical protein
MPDPSQEYLRANLHYDALTGIFKWRQRRFRAQSGLAAGCINREGYRQIRLDDKLYVASRLAWIYSHGEIPAAFEIDHRNGIRDDDRLENLRLATDRQQAQNRGRLRNNTSGKTGVIWNRRKRIWMAKIRIRGRRVYIGSAKSFEAACRLRDAAERICFGKFRRQEEIFRLEG